MVWFGMGTQINISKTLLVADNILLDTWTSLNMSLLVHHNFS